MDKMLFDDCLFSSSDLNNEVDAALHFEVEDFVPESDLFEEVAVESSDGTKPTSHYDSDEHSMESLANDHDYNINEGESQVQSKRQRKQKISSFSDESSDKDYDCTLRGKGKTGVRREGKRKCLSKNAIIARENRLKKKKYIETLEASQSKLSDQLKKYKLQVNNLEARKNGLEKEVIYLRNVIANSEIISSLVKCVKNTTAGELVGSSLLNSQDSYSTENESILSTNNSSNKIKANIVGGGICFHVADGFISLELCEKCSKSASDVFKTKRKA